MRHVVHDCGPTRTHGGDVIMSLHPRADAVAGDAGAAQIAEQADADLAEARRVLRAEAAALLAMAETVGTGDGFLKAVRLMQDCRGRIVVTGMGKSGHVGRKIASTLSSTGTPALFVHPGEAGHGDLGMIAAHDLVLAISNSGGAAELNAIIYYARRFGIPLVAITRDPMSQLGKAADACLLLPDLPEACPLSLAPMTSSTATLALGDALAAVLMQRRQFSAEHFRDYHPAGTLGALLLTVSDIMHGGDEQPIVARGTLMHAAILVMTEKRFGCVGVVDAGGQLVGIFTDGDLRRKLDRMLLDKPIDSVMVASPKVVAPDALVADAVKMMGEHKIQTVFAVGADGKPLGIVHLHDLLRSRIL
jgi:arabinose-5-phosphate isomerase